jgi:hypothetical protein
MDWIPRSPLKPVSFVRFFTNMSALQACPLSYVTRVSATKFEGITQKNRLVVSIAPFASL